MSYPQTLAAPFTPRAGYTPAAPAIILPPSSQHAVAASTAFLSSVAGSTTTNNVTNFISSTAEKASTLIGSAGNVGVKPYSISYHHLHQLTLDLQLQLASLGLKEGETVSSSLGNGVEFVLGFLSTGWQRLVAAPLNPAYTASEVEFYLSDTKSKVLLLPAGTFSAATTAPTLQSARKLKIPCYELIFDPLASDGHGAVFLKDEQGSIVKGADASQKREPQAEDTTLVLHTSGTTGRPKGVPLSHGNLVATMENIIKTYDLTSRDRTFLVMPLFHVHGMQAAFLSTLLSGGCVVLPPKFSASTFWPELVQSRCTWYTAVPTIHSMLLNSARPSTPHALRFIRSCSSSLAPSVFHALEEAFGVPVLEAYAMTEAAHQMTSNPLPSKGQRRPGSVGIGQGVEIRIIDQKDQTVAVGGEGEVCIRGRNVTKGYLNNPKANEESFVHSPPQGHEDNKGFFRTGDQGKLDEAGFLTLTGRIKELINRGGEKISPLEVDAALLALKKDPGLGIKEAVSFAMEDATYGQKVGAAVVVEGNVTQDDIRNALLDGRLSKFKVPERIWIVPSIPKTATGKIQRRQVSAQMVAGDKRENGKL